MVKAHRKQLEGGRAVTPAKAGVQGRFKIVARKHLDSGFHRNDKAFFLDVYKTQSVADIGGFDSEGHFRNDIKTS